MPFSKGMEDSGIDVALEVHLNGAVRRIEKHIEVRNYDDSWYDQKETARVFSMVKPVEIEATVRNWTSTYSNKWLGSTDGSLAAGAQVIYMDHSGDSAAYIWIPEEARACWVPYYSISISDKNYTVYEDFSDEDKEIFVNGKEYDSQSEYLIWINLERQKVNVFQGSKGQWDLIRVSTCSTGKNTTPTPTGVMTYCAYSDGWFNPTYYVKPGAVYESGAGHRHALHPVQPKRYGSGRHPGHPGVPRLCSDAPGRGELDCGPCAHWHHGGGILGKTKNICPNWADVFLFRLQPQQVFQISWLIFC